jgi:glycosyltransferase involved in cell wall biosynthesis
MTGNVHNAPNSTPSTTTSNTPTNRKSDFGTSGLNNVGNDGSAEPMVVSEPISLPRVHAHDEEILDVAIDVSAIKPNSGGVRRYAHELVAHLGAQHIRSLLLARSNDLIDAWPGADRFIGSAPSNRVQRLVWEQSSLLKTLRSAAPDVRILHSPHYTMPILAATRVKTGLRSGEGNGVKRSAARMKRVVTIHDLSYFTRPEDHSYDKRTLFRTAIARAAKSADALICVSDRTAQALQEFVSVSAPVFVAPHGIDHTRFRPLVGEDRNFETPRVQSANQEHGLAQIPTRADDQRARETLGIHGDYIVSISAIEPRKNLAMLIRAYEELLANDPSLRHITLVIGGEGWPGEVEQLPTSRFGNIVKTGFVPESCVAPLFRGALGVAYPSFEEGFGLPAIEALACGAPVVTTAGSVMHDLMGSAAIAVDVTQVETLAGGLGLAVSGNGPLLAERLAKAQTFTWTKSAQSHADAYRSCR